MTHVIDQTIDLIVAQLVDNTDAGVNVFTDASEITEKEKLPYIDVTYLSDTPSEEGMLGHHMRDVEIDIRIVNRKNTLGRRSVMDIRAQVEQQFNGCSTTMDSTRFDHVMNECEWDVESSAENNSYEFTMNYQFQVTWAHGVPDVFV